MSNITEKNPVEAARQHCDEAQQRYRDARRHYLEVVVNAPSYDDDDCGYFEATLKFDSKIRDAIARSDWPGIVELLRDDEGFPARYPKGSAGWPEELGYHSLHGYFSNKEWAHIRAQSSGWKYGSEHDFTAFLNCVEERGESAYLLTWFSNEASEDMKFRWRFVKSSKTLASVSAGLDS